MHYQWLHKVAQRFLPVELDLLRGFTPYPTKDICAPLETETYGTIQTIMLLLQQKLSFSLSCFHGSTAPRGPWPPVRCFSITLSHTNFDKTTLNE